LNYLIIEAEFSIKHYGTLTGASAEMISSIGYGCRKTTECRELCKEIMVCVNHFQNLVTGIFMVEKNADMIGNEML
jgi:hypothetical protein